MRLHFGLVFQQFNLFPQYTALENVTLAPLLGAEAADKDAIIEHGKELLEQMGLSDRMSNYPHQLSGGQQQRVAIARALALKPDILCFDEPTSALDPTMVGEVLSVIRKLANEGMTMMIVTHEMKFARDVSNRIFYMDEGGICEDGTPDQIFNHPKKEKTRVFIKRLKQLFLEVKDENYDFIGFTSEIEQFGRNNMLPDKLMRNVQLAFEEIVTQNLVPYGEVYNDLYPIDVMIEYSDADESLKMEINYSCTRYNPFNEGDELSATLIRKLTNDVKYSFKDEKNNIKIIFK
jgi:polar amino acid transport system ATP-binding protein